MGKQYLTFKLADTVYAVNVFQVREVLSYTPPQPLPRSDPIIEGLIRSRDQSIPVVNLRRKFGLADRQPDAASRIIVVEVNNYEEGSISVFGAVADSVNEVLDLDTIGFEDTPELGNSPAAAFIEGIGRQDDAFIIILDVDKIFSNPELSEMSELDNRTVAPEYAQYTQELPPQRHEPPPAEDLAAEAQPANTGPEPAVGMPIVVDLPQPELEESLQAAMQMQIEAHSPEEPQHSAAPKQALPAMESSPAIGEETALEADAGFNEAAQEVQGEEPEAALASPSAPPRRQASIEGLLHRAMERSETSGRPEAQAEEAQARLEELAATGEARQPQDAQAKQVLPAVKTPPVSAPLIEEEPAQEAEAPSPEPPQAQKEPPQGDALDGGYDALDFAPEDFELL